MAPKLSENETFIKVEAGSIIASSAAANEAAVCVSSGGGDGQIAGRDEDVKGVPFLTSDEASSSVFGGRPVGGGWVCHYTNGSRCFFHQRQGISD
jgi:hypothetical protein